MKIEPGLQIRVNERPAVILTILECPHCDLVTVFRPNTLAPPACAGTRRLGVWHNTIMTLWYYRDDQSWWADRQHPARVVANQDARSHVHWQRWLEAFSQHIRPPVLR
jgi:hypothetical protein